MCKQCIAKSFIQNCIKCWEVKNEELLKAVEKLECLDCKCTECMKDRCFHNKPITSVHESFSSKYDDSENNSVLPNKRSILKTNLI